MAKLLTHHDPLHIHAMIGVLVLLHYLYRFQLMCIPGRSGRAFMTVDDIATGRAGEKDVWFGIAGTLLHGLLSWSSLLLPLPKTRNFNSPMIWPEFRLHSIAFASRHVVGTIISILRLWPQNLVANYLSKVVLVFVTCYVADVITDKYGCKEKRTTNTMPYPENVTEKIQIGIKQNYAVAQFLAVLSVISENPDFSFFPLLGIQSAPLLMTLVRKGKASSMVYHRVYSFCLGFPVFFMLVAGINHRNKEIVATVYAIGLIHVLPYNIRVDWGWSKYNTWLLSILLTYCVLKGPMWNLALWVQSNPIGILYIVTAAWQRLHCFVPLFFESVEDVPPALHTMIYELVSGKRSFPWTVSAQKVKQVD